MPGDVSSPPSRNVHRGSVTQTISKPTSDKFRPQQTSDKENDNSPTVNGGPYAANASRRNSIALGNQGQSTNSSLVSLSTTKEQRNNFSLVREGYSSLTPNKARAKPKAKAMSTTPRDSFEETIDGNVSTSINDKDKNSLGSQAIPTDVNDDNVGDKAMSDTGDGREGANSLKDDPADQDGDVVPPLSLSNHRQTQQLQRSHHQSESKERIPEAPVSVRKRYYENADMGDVLQEKVATQLRENGIAETRIVSLSAKICQAVRDDIVTEPSERDRSHPQVVSNLTSAIHPHLDAILYQHPHHTDVRGTKPNDATHISQIVLMRVRQIHHELESCKQSLDAAIKSSPHRATQTDIQADTNTTTNTNATTNTTATATATATTPRDGSSGESHERSVILAIKEGIEAQSTDNEILADKLKQMEIDDDGLCKLKEKHLAQIKTLDEENWQLKKCLQESDHDNELLVEKVKDQDVERDKLERSLLSSRKEVELLKKQIGELKSQGRISAKELTLLQSEKARLQVLCEQRLKEILHLRDPDRDMVLQIRELKEEITLLRTQSRRLADERGMLRAKSQKLESALDESLKTRNKLTIERDTYFKEINEVRQRYRRLSLATPSQRTLPDIMTPRNGPSRATSRAASRADPSSTSNVLAIKYPPLAREESSRLTTHREEALEDGQER